MKRKIEESSVKSIYDELAQDGFAPKKLAQLVDSQYFETELWPQYQNTTDREAALLICFLFEQKRLQGLSTFSVLLPLESAEADERVSQLIGQILSSCLDSTLSFHVRSVCLSFLIDAAVNLDNPAVQQKFQRLVSILIWRDLSPGHRDELFERMPILKKRYRARSKALENAEGVAKETLLSDSTFIASLAMDVVAQLYTTRTDGETLEYCSRALEFLGVLLSQLPTRRYTFHLLEDLQFLCNLQSSPRYLAQQKRGLEELHAHFQVLEYYMTLPYDNFAGRELSIDERQEIIDSSVSSLQRTAMTEFKDHLLLMALSNHSTITNPSDMTSHLDELDDKTLAKLCTSLNIRTSSPVPGSIPITGKAMRAYIVNRYSKKHPFGLMQSSALLPTERSLFGGSRGRSSQSNDHLPIPKLTLQYLSVNDFLYRTFAMHQHAAHASIGNDLIATLTRLAPQIVYPSRSLKYNGTSANALPVSAPSVVEVAPPHIDMPGCPGLVRAELRLELSDLSTSTRIGWSSLKKGDVLFLIHLEASDETSSSLPNAEDPAWAEKIGIRSIRCAIIDSVLANDGRPLPTEGSTSSVEGPVRGDRMIRMLYDPITFQADKDQGKLEEIYDRINLVIKRKAEKNEFLNILQQIRRVARKRDEHIPGWFQEAFLGLGGAQGVSMPEGVDMHDTFIDLMHAKEMVAEASAEPKIHSHQNPAKEDDYGKMTVANLKLVLSGRDLPTTGKKAELVARLVDADKHVLDGCGPDSHDATQNPDDDHTANQVFQIELPQQASIVENDTRKKRSGGIVLQDCKLIVKTLRQPGPYTCNLLKRNRIPFTRAQCDAILAATLPGLTLVDGPPSTGKLAIVAQVISNIYHNEPEARTIVVCKSEQVMAALVSQLNLLDVPRIRILQLYLDAHTSPDLDYILLHKGELLAEVTRLAASLKAYGDHGASCETAAYFYTTLVEPFLNTITSAMSNIHKPDREQLDGFFSNAPLSQFNTESEYLEACRAYIVDLFAQLALLRPLELLKSPASQGQFLLTNLSKVVLTTSQYVAHEQSQLTSAGFYCTSVILHQAAVLNELDSFSPFTFLENPDHVERLVLVGDQRQCSSRVAMADNYRRSTNADQSLFTRLQRSGISTMRLTEQFACRSSIREIYEHRYSVIQNTGDATPQEANAGFSHVQQFIDVPSYKGQGEFSPRPGIWQNLGEAEYVVALYQYMRLLNYPREKITLLTPFEGQKQLIQDVLDSRCKRSPIFGMPSLATVDEYHGQKNDYILLSLVRWSGPCSELCDLGRMTTALSRGTKGLYVFGKRSTLPGVLNPFLRHLDMTKESQLELVTGEMHPTSRMQSEESPKNVAMVGVEHLGKYVYEMTQKKLEAMSR